MLVIGPLAGVPSSPGGLRSVTFAATRGSPGPSPSVEFASWAACNRSDMWFVQRNACLYELQRGRTTKYVRKGLVSRKVLQGKVLLAR